jgi:hypothetical protein
MCANQREHEDGHSCCGCDRYEPEVGTPPQQAIEQQRDP